jgi:wyosine [tRNA(Phe)-imidazoG37] synthetase (radical SAM superfamily)
MDCIYCQYASPKDGDTGGFPSAADVLAAVESALEVDATCDAITIAGNGEPTLHPQFLDIVSGLVVLRDRLAPQVKLVLLTNGTRLGHKTVQEALRALDTPVIKLDAGDPETLKAINRPHSSGLGAVIKGLKEIERYELQALFVAGPVTNATAPALDRWIELVCELQPERVQVTTVDRGTSVPGVLPVPEPQLRSIAERLVALGVRADAYPCSNEDRFQ